MAGLELRGVRKTYGSASLETLKGIDLKVEEGQFLILVGPSGCGKSTLMNAIAGLESITAGSILIDGQDVTDVEPKDRDIAMVFQSYALYPTMTVRENISFGLRIRKTPVERIDEEVARVAALLQIEPLLERKPAQLSGGQQQRVAMGRALARRPRLYLFDEPLSNLDAKLRVEMRTEIKLMHQRLKTTTVYVTHDQVEAMTLGDCVAVMKDGEVQQFGTPETIYKNPRNLFVASFIGSPPMNFVPVSVAGNAQRVSVRLNSDEGTAVIDAPGLDPALIGRTVLLGIRPEQIALNAHGERSGQEHDGAGVPTRVLVVEPTGPDTLLYAEWNGIKVCCRVAPDQAPAAGTASIWTIDARRAVYFDPESGERLA
ncbi:ABC transporter ATP-binding protein [Pseudomonas matsuisoli]|uniref:Sugar ABC transporter ATP-binding protein n=1 Tax=Pseudomonas matsuisoli TaxID=1515666 RepID=A0A917Q1H8_9PSED|nr:sn-glycerol-3-phosphate ABC transporter ATP-binding protein UgpC [Pseudomonas matsuisoli]GGK06967.1 sugar ABC transporter ATP-binding protein [Pseudomonas matsuisoli]